MLQAIIKIRPLSVGIPDNENDPENQHISIEANGVSDFDIMQAAQMIVEMMRMSIVDSASKELIEAGNLKPSKKEVNDYINSSLDTRNNINGFQE